MTPQQCLAFWPHSSLKRWQELCTYFGSDNDWWAAGLDAPRPLKWVDSAKASFVEWRKQAQVERYAEQLTRTKITLVTHDAPAYPPELKELHEPPLGLFIRGTMPNGLRLGAVGTRRPTPYGKQAATLLIPSLARAGLTIVSGLAYGLDALCHTLTLDVGGGTVAVLGSGVDRTSVQPVANQNLADRIVANGGAVLSEYPPGTPAAHYTFPMRNRIIAALCPTTLVIEAPEGSGALITADVAAQLGRNVACVPHPITSANGAGSNRWLSREGAQIVTDVTDVLVMYPGLIKNKTPIVATINPVESELLRLIPVTGKHINAIVLESGKNPAEIFSVISELELNNVIVNLGGQHYARRT